MSINTFDKDMVVEKVDNFAGLEHIGNGNNEDIDKYFNSFMTWLNWNNVLDIVNNYADVDMTLKYVTPIDFLIWLLHYGDVYDNLLKHQLKNNPLMDYQDEALELFDLRQLHPKFSFTVALTSRMQTNALLSDNDLDQMILILSKIPDNSHLDKSDIRYSELGEGLFKTLYCLSNFAVERESKYCF